MKVFEVELKRTSYVVFTVEAKDAEQAEKLAWEELASSGSDGSRYADWEVESIEESK